MNRAKRKADDTAAENDTTEDVSSAPLNFDTFVPTHDASLSYAQSAQAPSMPSEISSQYNGIASHYGATLPHAEGDVSSVSPDTAFSHAIGAMYWCGYWTAVYHVCFAPSFSRIQREG